MAKKILFVDDDELWRKRVTASFGSAGLEIVTAQDASEAMALCEEAHPAVIILDVNLNGEDGIMLLKFLKRNHPHTPILLYTAVHHDKADIEKMLKLGADQYLPKASIEELLVAVSAYT